MPEKHRVLAFVDKSLANDKHRYNLTWEKIVELGIEAMKEKFPKPPEPTTG